MNLPEVTAQDFLSHLAGLVKYTLAKKDGQTTISALAAVTAQREATIRLGLEWLAAGGQVMVDVEGDEVKLMQNDESGMQSSDKYVKKEFFIAVKGLLEEALAFREHFRVAEIKSWGN